VTNDSADDTAQHSPDNCHIDLPPIPVFVCPRCGRESANPNDVEFGYCGACRDWTGDSRAPVALFPWTERELWSCRGFLLVSALARGADYPTAVEASSRWLEKHPEQSRFEMRTWDEWEGFGEQLA
jgi:hypothetical protein